MNENSDKNKNNCDKEEKKSICSNLIDFQSILTEQYDKEINKITTLINFLEKISSEYQQFYTNLSSHEYYLNEKSDNYIFNDMLSSLYIYQSEIFENFKIIPEKINKEIIIPLKKVKKVYEKESKKIISSIKEIIEQLSLHQDVLNIIKKEYYDENKKLELIEKNNKKENINNHNNNQIMQKMSNQTKLIENKFSLYKKEVEVMKKLYSDCEKDFRNLKQKMQDNDMKRNNSIFIILNNYIKMIINNIKIYDKQNNNYDIKLNQYKSILNNTQSIEDVYNNVPELNMNWKYDFDISLENKEKDDENNDNDKNEEISNNEEENKEKLKNPIKYEELLIMPSNNYEIEGIDINYMQLNKLFYEKIPPEIDEESEKFSNDLSNISDFFKILYSEKIIESEQKNKITNILEKYQGNINCYIKFCDACINSNANKLKDIFEFKSFSNLLKNLIENISDKLINNDIKAYILFDQIVCFGEKSMYEDTYMCKLLSSENQVFKRDIIWKNSIKNKLINLLDDICKKEYYTKNPSDFNYIRKSIDVFGKIFQRKESGKANNIIELYELDKYIKIYNKLNSDKVKNIGNKYGKNVIHELIKCYIRHMINYNFLNYHNTQIQVEEIIKNILEEFLINDNSNTKFFNLYYHSNLNSIRKPITNEKEKLRKNLQIQFINNYEMDKNKIFILKKASKYLEQKSEISLINLSKKFLDINKYIYHQILKKDDDFNSTKRIGIWKILLKYNESLKKYDYQKILNEVNKIPFNEKEGKDFLITVDIKRTKFKAKENNGQKILCNLLRCLVYNNNNNNENKNIDNNANDNNNKNNNDNVSNNNNNDNEQISYCQGMNFITALFYDIIKNEEETFHLLKSFFINGKFGIIFKNKLTKLKDYFIILEKLIFLYLPKIYHKLIDNQIQVNFFSSPYFITLFTNIYYFHQDNANKFLLHSLDDFILNGWCSVFSTIICVLKYFEKKILNLNGEELIKFIVNDIGKSDLFIDEKYNTFYKLKKQNWISKELLECLEEETQTEREIKSEFNNNNNNSQLEGK